jgi:biotin operon repressor
MAESNAKKWTSIPSRETVDAAVSAMKSRGFDVVVTETKGKALEALKAIIPRAPSS